MLFVREMDITMKVLVINGGCLTVNSSANLCHIAYIKGLIENGHEVTVASADERGQIIDHSIELPTGAKYNYYPNSILYKFLRPNSWKQVQNSIQNNKDSLKTELISFAKRMIAKIYGPFGYNGFWVHNFIKQYKGESQYDVIISISSPVYSHLAAVKLIKSRKVKCEKHIEIWEDPWQLDLYNEVRDEKLLAIEHKLVFAADKIVYVSPLTARYQSEMFKDCSAKITWVPLPYYYMDTSSVVLNNTFGYFGDYFPTARNLKNFYEVAKRKEIKVTICGSPETLFNSTSNIAIYPRLNLDKLKVHENNTSILVFVCNIRGGQIPGKIYQYAATHKRILFILDGTEEEQEVIYSFFRRFNRFYFCKNTEEDISRAIDLILSGNQNVNNEPLEFFSPQNIIRLVLRENNECI